MIERARTKLTRANPWRVAVLGVTIELFVALHLWQAVTGAPRTWHDSADYRAVASAGWLSSHLWAGIRPPLLPLAWKVAGSDDGLVILQTVAACACWLLLVWAVASLARPGWSRVTAALAVLVFASTRPILQWNRSVLSETLALGATALMLAALIHVVRRRSWPSVTALAAATALFVSVRDTHAVVGVFMATGATLLVVACARHRPWKLAVCALALWLVAGSALVAAERTERGLIPLANLMATRVFPYQDRLAWFTDHGLAQADEIAKLEPAFIDDVGLDQTWVDPREPQWADYREWLLEDGRTTYLRWMLAHPGYAIEEPLVRPQRVTNNAHGNLEFYAAPDRFDVPIVTAVFFPGVQWWTAAGAVLLLVGVRRRLWRSAMWWMLAGFSMLGVVHMLIAWHGDGMEATRHALVGNVQARLGVLALAVLTFLGGRSVAPEDEHGERPAAVADGRGVDQASAFDGEERVDRDYARIDG